MAYCQHFASLSMWKLPPINKYACTTCKTGPPIVWLCLSKNCGGQFCQRQKHMTDHCECTCPPITSEFHWKHCIFLNPTTAEIRCLCCKIQILDLQHIQPDLLKQYRSYPDPYSFRQRYLKHSQPPLLYNTGHLQNSAAHKKSNRGLCSLIDRPQHSAINSCLQFISNVPFYRKIMKHCVLGTLRGEYGRLLGEMFATVKRIWTGEVRSITITELTKLICEKMPKFRGYKRKDPCELLIYLLNAMHEELRFYDFQEMSNQPVDDWEILKKLEETETSPSLQHSVMKETLNSELIYTFQCEKCKQTKLMKGNLFRLELQIPKVRKKSKQIQLQFTKHRYQSPMNKRRRSLIDRLLGVQQQFPISLPQLIINFMNTHTPQQDKTKLICPCSANMKVKQSKFNQLPSILLIKIGRTQKDTSLMNNTNVDCPEAWDMSGFVVDGYKGPTAYELASTICFTQEGQFIAVAKNCKNRQKYEFRNASVKICSTPFPIYLACYSLRDPTTTPLYHNIKSNLQLGIRPQCQLPDFWLQKLRYFSPGPLFNPSLCPHSKLKPKIQARSTLAKKIPKQVYLALVEKFGGMMVEKGECEKCEKEMMSLITRKRQEKEVVTLLDSYRCRSSCMVSCQWIGKWTEFLYKKKNGNHYLVKGMPPPGPINNGVLLENSVKCRADLKKGVDYKVVNYYVWTLFKELYGGGPEIQYRTKSDDKSKSSHFDPQVVADIPSRVRELKMYMNEEYYMGKQWQQVPSPMKGSSRQLFQQKQ